MSKAQIILMNLLDACSLTKVDVMRCFNDAEGQQWKHSLFGIPNEPVTFRRRCEIVETLGEKNFDLAFQVLGTAINVYANKHEERPDRLIDMLISSHGKVLACVVCGHLRSAFQIGYWSGSVADVQYVTHQALHTNALPVLDMCKQWWAQYV